MDDALPMIGLQLQLKMAPDRAKAAAALADELQKGDSPKFHQWLTAEQYGEQFGVGTGGHRQDQRVAHVTRLHGG